MAMGFHCSSLISPPNPSGFSYALRQLLPTKLRVQGQDALAGHSKSHTILSKESSIYQLFNAIRIFKIGKNCIDFSAPTIKNGLQSSSVKQMIRFPEVAFLVTNALLMAMPSEALAETCELDSSPFNMPLLLAVALIGATVGGLVARKRKEDVLKLNEQLRQINAALRRQAKIESYAPTLSYAPVGSRISETEVIVDPSKEELIYHLRTGKNHLRNLDPEKAFAEFKEALELAQKLKDPVEEKKAARGLGASLQRQAKYREAIKYHSMVLAISKRVGESSGNTEAYGAIADCYTELGDLEKAAKFYDKYIARLEAD